MAPKLNHLSRKKSPSFPLRLGAVLLSLALPSLAHADEYDPISVVFGAGVRAEGNLFRLSSANQNNLPSGASSSDRIASASAGVRFNKAYSLQQFQLDVTATRYSYDKNKALDFTGVDYRGAWLWQVTPHVTGTLTADRTERSADYAYYSVGALGTRNKQTNENRGFTIDGEVAARWHLVGGVHQNKSTNDFVFNPVGNYRLNSGEAGVRYVTPEENSATAVARSSRGEYLGRSPDPVSLLDSGFDQHEAETRIIWHASAHSLFNGRLGYLERKHDNFSQRDFSGAVGQLDYTWLPTAKTQVLFSLVRDLASYQEAAHSYYVLDGFAISPTWQLSDKTTLRARLDLNRREFHGAVASVSTMREDRNRLLSFGADWRASRNVLVTASLQREHRTSNLTGLDYSATVASLSAQIAF